MLPVIFSAELGLNVTVIPVFCPAARVTGVDIPPTAKSFAFTLTCEMVRLVLPLLAIVTVFELELPAFTPEKVKLPGLEDSVTDAAVPLPLRARTFGELGALLVILTVPVWLPPVVGANNTLKLAVPPAAIVAGVASPLALKAVPDTAKSAMVKAAVPVLVTVIVWDLVCPSTRVPKLKDEGEIDRPG